MPPMRSCARSRSGYPSREEMPGLVAQLGHVAIICGVTAGTFSRLITGPVTYLQYDDEKNYDDVAQLYSFSSESLRWVWEDGVVLGVWEPVALLFKMAWHVGTGGGGPAVCFAVNLALHTTNGVAVYLLLANSRPWISAKAQEQWQLCVMLSTLGFAAHPLRCEVVCWASCQPYREHAALQLICPCGALPLRPNNAAVCARVTVGAGLQFSRHCCALQLSECAVCHGRQNRQQLRRSRRLCGCLFQRQSCY